MIIINCRVCNQVFVKDTHDLCPHCYQKDLDQFREATTFIRKNPATNMKEISHELNISLDTLLRWKRDGRI